MTICDDGIYIPPFVQFKREAVYYGDANFSLNNPVSPNDLLIYIYQGVGEIGIDNVGVAPTYAGLSQGGGDYYSDVIQTWWKYAESGCPQGGNVILGGQHGFINIYELNADWGGITFLNLQYGAPCVSPDFTATKEGELICAILNTRQDYAGGSSLTPVSPLVADGNSMDTGGSIWLTGLVGRLPMSSPGTYHGEATQGNGTAGWNASSIGYYLRE